MKYDPGVAYEPVPTDSEERARMKCLRDGAREFAEAIIEHCPAGRERDQALVFLETASMWSVKAITHGDT